MDKIYMSNQSKIINTDIAIIGAGPSGLFAAFEAGMLGLKSHIIEALDKVGGQCSALYPEKSIFDIPAHPEISGQNLINQLYKQTNRFQPTYHLNQRVLKLNKMQNGIFRLQTNQNTIIDAGAVIIAAGCGAIVPNKPIIKNIEKYEESGQIHYYIKNTKIFQNKHIVICGGGDSALDWAISLYNIAQKVTLIHRRSKFRGTNSSIATLNKLVSAEKINLMIPYHLKELQGTQDNLRKIIITTLKGQQNEVQVDHLLMFFGLAMQLGPILNWGLKFNKNHILINKNTMETSIPGIFAIGDIGYYDKKLKLIVSGFAEAATAIHAARYYLFPKHEFHFQYSTNKIFALNN